MAASSSRGRSSSPYQYRKPSSPFSSSSSSSSFMNGRLMPRSCSSSATSFYGSGNGYGTRSVTPSRHRNDSMYPRAYGGRSPVAFASADELIGEPIDVPRSGGDSISVTIRFRPLRIAYEAMCLRLEWLLNHWCSEREYQRGDEISWYADGDKIVRNEYNLATAYAFDKVFGPSTASQEVYEVAARPVVKAAMEGVNGMVPFS
ncbi:kinesin motor family protein [Actinidia rufa]|uniref:Kinesin motor family protein n=1 Tax=Actinidia rufa TaxID=165716 RepID=A0A7J0EV84_9ERIC|nr:kinesin motor family protein [Actinidia rufa]